MRVAAATPPFFFVLLLVPTWCFTAYEVLLRQPELYLVSSGAARVAFGVALVIGALLGVVGSRRRPEAARGRVSASLFIASCLAASSGMGWFFASQSRAAELVLACLLPLTMACALMLIALDTWRALGPSLMRVRALARLVNAFRLGAWAVCIGSASWLLGALGVLRASIALGLALVVLGWWWQPLLHYLLGGAPSGRQRWLGPGILVLELGLFLASERLVPLRALGRTENPIVFADFRAEEPLVVTSGQQALELFVGHRLRVSMLDEYRYFEGLVHPALVFAPSRRRVLVLGGGHGAIERELLRYPEVEQIRVVSAERQLVELGRRAPWLRALSGDALRSPRVQVTVEEPAVWLERRSGSYDVIVTDLQDPVDYRDGKHYTRAFYARLREHLSPEGVAVVQTVSPLYSPRTHANVLTTLRAAGFVVTPYRVAVPTLGEWSFALASRTALGAARPLPQGLRFLNAGVLAASFRFPSDTQRAEAGPPSFLHAPRVVELFEEERELRGF